jgi:type VI secretion system protein ImpM
MSDADVTSAQRAGFFGKLPSRGDFVKRNLPRDFLAVLDDWLQHAMQTSRDVLQEDWLNCYLRSPIWRFVLPDGVFGGTGWCGTMMPSVDRVNRYFPLVIAAPVAAACPSFTLKDDNDDFFLACERLSILALEDDDLDLDDFTASVTALQLAQPVASGPDAMVQLLDGGGMRVTGTAASLEQVLLDGLCRKSRNPYSIWWTAAEDGDGHLLLLDGVPQHRDYVDLITISGGAEDPLDAIAGAPADVDDSEPLI